MQMGNSQAATVTSSQNLKAKFIESLNALHAEVERIRSLDYEIIQTSKEERERLLELRESQHIAKAYKEEYSRELKYLRSTHIKYIQSGLSGFLFNLAGSLLMIFVFVAFAAVIVFVPIYNMAEASANLPPEINSFIQDVTGDSSFSSFFTSQLNAAKIVTLIVVGAITALSFVFFLRWYRKSATQELAFNYPEHLPLYIPDNIARQEEINDIVKHISRKIPTVLRDGDRIVRQELREKRVSEDMKKNLQEIKKFNDLLQHLTKKNRIKATNKHSWKVVNEKYNITGTLKTMAGVVGACVAIGIILAAPVEYEVTWSDGSKTREWR